MGDFPPHLHCFKHLHLMFSLTFPHKVGPVFPDAAREARSDVGKSVMVVQGYSSSCGGVSIAYRESQVVLAFLQVFPWMSLKLEGVMLPLQPGVVSRSSDMPADSSRLRSGCLIHLSSYMDSLCLDS